MHQPDRALLALWFAGLNAIAIAFAFLRGLNDSDLFWHLLNGEQILATGAPITIDTLSFTNAGGRRIPHEWLSEALMFVAVDVIGPDLALGVFALALPAGFAAVGFSLHGRGVRVSSIMVASVLPALVALPYASVRPQVLSWGLLALTVALLLRLNHERRFLLLALIPLMALWANVHGLYAVGIAVVGWYVLWTLLGKTGLKTTRALVISTGIASLGATLLTPSGLDGLLYPLRFLNASDWGLTNIPEWTSPNFHDAVQLPLLLLIVSLAALGRGRAPGWSAGLAYIGIAMVLMANRNAPPAAIFALPVLAYAIDARAQRRGSRSPSPFENRARVLMAAATVVIVFVAAAIAVLPRATGVQLGLYPVRGVDALEAEQPDARVLAEYGWGGYVAYRLNSLGGRVFVDGRNDMYPEEVLYDYLVIRDADAGWADLVSEYGVEAILLPPDRPLVKGIAQANGWCEVVRDERQVLLLPCDDV